MERWGVDFVEMRQLYQRWGNRLVAHYDRYNQENRQPFAENISAVILKEHLTPIIPKYEKTFRIALFKNSHIESLENDYSELVKEVSDRNTKNESIPNSLSREQKKKNQKRNIAFAIKEIVGFCEITKKKHGQYPTKFDVMDYLENQLNTKNKKLGPTKTLPQKFFENVIWRKIPDSIKRKPGERNRTR